MGETKIGPIRGLTWNSARSLFWQSLVVFFSWIYFVSLNWTNNGLWYQGDSSVHASNGLFWEDFFRGVPANPLRFALSYYARYPSVSPTHYPPFFYWLEALVYWLVGESPFVPKALVLAFVLFAGFYLSAWLRRFVSAEAGWLAVLLFFQPLIVTWGHAVMLSLPSAALGIAALYHWRRWIQDPASGQIWWAGVFVVLAVFTYLPAIVVLGVMLASLIQLHKIRLLLDRRLLVNVGVVAVLLAAWVKVTGGWNGGFFAIYLYLGPYPAWTLGGWLYYPLHASDIVNEIVILLASVAILLAWFESRWREEILLSLIWILVCYVFFCIFAVKELRHIMFAVPPLILLATIGVFELRDLCFAGSPEMSRNFLTCGVILLAGWNVWDARNVQLPSVSGFGDVANYVRAIDDKAWAFYDGEYSQLFTYYYRLADPDFHGGVVRASKLLYATNLDESIEVVEIAKSPADVTRLIQRNCGCKYFVVERQPTWQIRPVRAESYFRSLLKGGDFRLLKSFPVRSPEEVTDVDLYEYTAAFVQPKELVFAFPIVGAHTTIAMTPIHERE